MADILSDDETGERFTPTEWLVMEVLAARWRLGETVWPFPTRLRPTLRELERRCLITWKGGIVEGTLLAQLTRDGREMWMPDTAGERSETPAT